MLEHLDDAMVMMNNLYSSCACVSMSHNEDPLAFIEGEMSNRLHTHVMLQSSKLSLIVIIR